MTNHVALALSLIPNLKPIERQQLASICATKDDLKNFSGDILLNTPMLGLVSTKARQEKWANISGVNLLTEAENLLDKLEKRAIKITHIFDENYPPLLKEIYDPPFLLYYRGELANPNRPCLSVIGTRRPSLRARQETSFFVRECSKSLGSIVSGLALGIDGMAHKAALAEFSHTTAVLGSGFNYLYPSPHKSLAARIIDEGGLVITEFHPDVPPNHYNFPARNRIVSGLSRGTIVMEAPLKSGTLITADFALEQGRDLFIHAAALEDENTGVSKLHDDGALALRRGDDLLYLWNIPKVPFKGITINRAPEELNEKPSGLKTKVYNISEAVASSLWAEISNSDDIFKR